MAQWLRLHTPNAGVLGSIPDQGTRSHILQLRVHMLQLKIPNVTTKKILCATTTKTKRPHMLQLRSRTANK